MSEQQLWLIPQPRPLQERLGDDFFRKLPRLPGVYIMTDCRERVLYVGQSKNLRHRLASYKNLRPGKDARRLVRLAQAVAAITWEECQSPAAARLRENELLRLYRPKFNRVNTRPEAYGYFELNTAGGTLTVRLTQHPTPAVECYGAFKGARLPAFASLVRLLLAGTGKVERHDRLAPGLLRTTLSRTYRLVLELNPGTANHWAALLREYLTGHSNELTRRFREMLEASPGPCLFWRKLQELDLETVATFYERGPRRNRELKKHQGLAESLIAPADLDDCLALIPTGSESDG